MGELWDVNCKDLRETSPHYNDTAVYLVQLNDPQTIWGLQKQNTGSEWLIHDTKYHKDSQF